MKILMKFRASTLCWILCMAITNLVFTTSFVFADNTTDFFEASDCAARKTPITEAWKTLYDRPKDMEDSDPMMELYILALAFYKDCGIDLSALPMEKGIPILGIYSSMLDTRIMNRIYLNQ